jgi:hypothetical protein
MGDTGEVLGLDFAQLSGEDRLQIVYEAFGYGISLLDIVILKEGISLIPCSDLLKNKFCIL